MCGIVGYVGPRDATGLLVEGLHRVEYRGYDSAGVAVLRRPGRSRGDAELRVHRTAGRVGDLEASLPARWKGSPGIGHTRWATHGEPTEANAHPHTDASGRVAVVHNGIVENADELRAELASRDVTTASDTDSEVVAHLVAAALDDGADLEQAVRRAVGRVVGTYGLAVLDARSPDRIVIARNGSPVLIGIGEREMFVASDPAAVAAHVRRVVHLDDGELASVTADGYRTFTLDDRTTEKRPSDVDVAVSEPAGRDGYEHFLAKEIAEQPRAIEQALRGRVDDRFATVHLGGLNMDVREARAFRRVTVLGCGSACFAGELGAQMIEDLARVPARAESASEFRYRNPVVEPDTLYVAVSQSGETADTLAAVQELQRKGGRVIGIVNVVGSTIARQVDGGIYLHAGPERSVASTKAFTSTLVAFALLAVHLGRMRDLSPADGRRVLDALGALPGQVRAVLDAERETGAVAAVAKDLAACPSVLYIGRRHGWAVAREGAQKLKEVSYVHAEAYAAAELKHGPLALVGPELPTVAVVPDDDLLDKNASTLAEIRARRGPVVAVGHRDVPGADRTLVVPRSVPELDPVLLSVPLQLLAYHAAVALGRDVDRPRNLAKSVTVE